MPAHLSRLAAASRLKSDGSQVTMLEWRANRLVDALAKLGAQLHRLPARLVQDVNSALAALEHAAALLGVVTRASNVHTVSVTRPGGTRLCSSSDWSL